MHCQRTRRNMNIEYTKWVEPNGFIEHRTINGKEYIFENFCSKYYDDDINTLLQIKSEELDGEQIERFSESPFDDTIMTTMRKSKEEKEKIQKDYDNLMELVKDKSYRNDSRYWKVGKYDTWYWNTNYYDLEKSPNWVRINEHFEAIILNMKNKDEEERCKYRNSSFGDCVDDPCFYNKPMQNFRRVKKVNNPKVYKYINKETNETDYIGIVWSADRELKKRIKEHLKYDKMDLDKYEVHYFDVETKADAEVWEGHLITYYGTQERLNKSKANWGLCTFLKGQEDSIDWIKYEVDNK